MLLGQDIPFGHSLGLCPGEVKDIPKLFFKEEDLFYRSSLIGLDHLRDEEMFFYRVIIKNKR